jgi:DNA-binding HxlR family transcriptional regulator
LMLSDGLAELMNAGLVIRILDEDPPLSVA